MPARAAPLEAKAAARPAGAAEAALAGPLGPTSVLQLQRAAGNRAVRSLLAARAPAANGLPLQLKAGIEALSGVAMDDVVVHRSSPEPAKVHAHAFTRGNTIHLAPGQDRHLPHEAWHAVQQKRGEVRPTLQLRGIQVNADTALEQAADRMGAQAEALGRTALEQPRQAPLVRIASPQDAVVQGEWEDLLWPLLRGGATLAAIGLGYLTYRWWPPGRTLADLRAIYQHTGLRPVLTFASIAGWNSPSVIALAAAFGQNANQLPASDWAAVAAALPPNAHVHAIPLARVAGWNGAGVLGLAAAFAAGANGRSGAQWAAIAALLPANAHADAAHFARIPNWQQAEVINLVGAYNANQRGLNPQGWAQLAAAVPGARWPLVDVLAERAPAPPPHAVVAGTAFTAPQIQRADHIYNQTGNLAPVRGWVAGGRRLVIAVVPVAPRVLAGVVQPPALDGILGGGAHAHIVADIALAGGRPYVPNPFVRGHAQTLVNAGIPQADALDILRALVGGAATSPAFTRGVVVAHTMEQRQVPVAQTRSFLVNHTAVAIAAANHNLLIDPGAAADALTSRAGVTAASLVATLALLAPLGAVAADALITNRFPATAGLTLPRLSARIDHFVNTQHIAIGNVGNEFQSVGQTIANLGVPANAAGWIRAAFLLIRGATRAGMNGFLNTGAVNNTFANGAATNAAHWLLRFARYHRGAPGGAFAGRHVQVNAGGAPRNVFIDHVIIDHVQRRHTYEHFRLTPAIINRAPQSTLITPPTTDVTIADGIQAILGAGPVAAAFPWAAGVAINPGAVQLMIEPDPAVANQYLVRQYYYAVAPGLGDAIPAAILTVIRARFPTLVY